MYRFLTYNTKNNNTTSFELKKNYGTEKRRNEKLDKKINFGGTSCTETSGDKETNRMATTLGVLNWHLRGHVPSEGRNYEGPLY